MIHFLKKQDAINYYEGLYNKNDKYLFQEDINIAGNKTFYVGTQKAIFDKIKNCNIPHYYEFWTDKMKILFSVDIDIDLRKITDKVDNILLNIIKIIIEGAKKYYNYEYKESDIIILENDVNMQKIEKPMKYSSHIIFRGLAFDSCMIAKDFYMRLDKDYNISKLFVDKSIYNMTCLRLCFNSKYGKESILVPKYINNNNCKTLFEYFKKTMITYTEDCNRIITEKKYKNNILLPKYNDKDITNIELEYILENLPKKYYEDYDLWIKVGMILYNYSSEEKNYFEQWKTWSKKSEKYKEKEMISKWKSFETSSNKLTIGTLIKWAKDEGIVKIYKQNFNDIHKNVTLYPIKNIQLNITENPVTIVNMPKLNIDIYKKLLHNKLLAIQSEKGTGKTYNLIKTLFEEEKMRLKEEASILFISSRVTFGFKLLGDLYKYGFKLYSKIKDRYIYEKRVICQIDSLNRIKTDMFDIIIVDEAESLARYMSSSHFTKKSDASIIVSNFMFKLHEAKKVIILDADLSDRCINFYKNIVLSNSNRGMHILINQYKIYTNYKIKYCKYATWVMELIKLIEQNKKIVIPMASNIKAKDIYAIIKEKFPDKNVLLIHKETSEEDKQQLLLKVNETWIKYDVVIYTPSVCMGVSFEVDNYFDYIFTYGCHESLGAQELCQMMHRVRIPLNKEIYVSIDNYKVYNEEDELNYETVEKIICSDYYLTNYDLHNNLIQKRIVKTNSVNKLIDEGINIIETSNSITSLYYPFKDDPIYDLYVRNCWEQIENKLNFAAVFFGYVKYKNYQLEYVNSNVGDNNIINDIRELKMERQQNEKVEEVTSIYNAKELSDEEYKQIRKMDVLPEEINAIKKYNIRKCYELPKIENDLLTKELIAEYMDINKMKWHKNISMILSDEKNDIEEKLQIIKRQYQNNVQFYSCFDILKDKNAYAYHYYPLEIIKILEFNINKLDLCIEESKFKERLEIVIEFCSKNKDIILYKYNIRLKEKNMNELTNMNKLKLINKILIYQYGLRVRKNKTKYKLSDNGIWDNLPNKIVPKKIHYFDEEFIDD